MAVAGAAAALPWHRSGEVTRRGFELAGAADRAGLVTAGWQRALLVAVYLLPMLVALAFLAAVLERRRWVGGMSCAAGIVGLASAAVVARLSDGRQAGPAVAVLAAVVAVGCGLHLLLEPRRIRDRR